MTMAPPTGQAANNATPLAGFTRASEQPGA